MSEFGDFLPKLTTPVPGPASQALADRLRAVESRNVTYLSDDFPVFWSAARGANVRDADGNVFLDFTGAFGVALAGHAHPTISARVRAQMDLLVHAMGDVHPAAVKVELLERLATVAPWDDARSFLAGSGSEAVEAALKTGALATGRPGILAFEGAYHGLTVGSLAVTGRPFFRDPFVERLYGGVAFAPFPSTGPAAAVALEAVARALEVGAPDGSPIGTVILEPIQGRAGVVIPPPGFLQEVVRLARRAGSVTVMDEIFTGLGRTGHVLASVAAGALPDIVCIGKALGGGLPISACIGRRDVMDAWPASAGEALHTSTFLGHPLGAAAALGFLDVLDQEDLCGRAAEVGATLLDGLAGHLSGVECVAAVRGAGLLLAVEPAIPGGPHRGFGARVATRALGKGLLVLPAGAEGHVVELAPPACLTDEQVKWGVGELASCIREELSA